MNSLEHAEISLCEVCEHTYTRSLAISPAHPYEFNSLHTTSHPEPYLTQIQCHLTRCNELLQHLQKVTHLVQQEQSALEQLALDYTAQSAAIRRLVPEILVRVFMCLEEDVNGAASSGKLSFPPVIMSQVCSAWRALAHSTPQLWTQISINTSSPRYEKMSEVYLDRSKPCLLDITIKKVQFQRMVAPLFEPHLHRIRALRCPLASISSRIPIKTSLGVEKVTTFSNLETLELSKMPISLGWEIGQFSFPNIKSFSMQGAIPQELITLLPWAQITHVKTERSPELLAILETHGCLRSLELFIPPTTFGSFSSQLKKIREPIIFGSLRRLRIELDQVPEFINDLTILNIPNLESFALRHPEPQYRNSQSSNQKDSLFNLMGLAVRSGCEATLIELELHWGGSANSKHLTTLLETTPNVKHLTFLISKPSRDNNNNTNAELFFERLSASPVTFLPHLQTITLSRYAVLPTHLPMILHARRPTLSSLVLGDWIEGTKVGSTSSSIGANGWDQESSHFQFMRASALLNMKENEQEGTRKVMNELRKMKSDGWEFIKCQHSSPDFREVCKICM
ncbi:hypothetical protein DL96DRAFT_1820331 [Flagelloscypha sp. PMI_526]|nr:hypothetical protein DL96DRAFT_1820331 [Flagelloscypha sp. PMI_526]